jgi:lipoprotein-releasing system permease protein
MRLKTGDSLLMFFVQYPPRFKKLAIKGIYETGLEELDDQVIIGDIKLNQNLNNWADTLVGGYEIYIKNFSQLDEVSQKVFEVMDYDMQLEKITDKYLQIFDWLTLLRRNVRIFLVLILFVACFNMVSTIFIMIMERTNMIGLLKALGARNDQVHAIFIYNGLFIILRGMLFGNLIGLGFCALQYYFKLIPLDPENYYMSSVPIEWNWLMIVLLNLLIFVMISLVLVIPVFIISRISPIKAIKFN